MITKVLVNGVEQDILSAIELAECEAMDDSGAQLRISRKDASTWVVEKWRERSGAWEKQGHVVEDDAGFVSYASTLPAAQPFSRHNVFLDAVESVGSP